MSKRYQLLNIENYWSSEYMVQANEYLDQETMTFSETDQKGLYSVLFQDENSSEVEVKIIKNEVRKYSCDCPKFQSELECVHIPAALLFIRGDLKPNAPKKVVQKKTRRLHINQLAEQVPASELILFIKDMARKDATISLLFKTRFIRSFDFDPDLDRYDMLLSSIIKIGKNGRVKLSRTQQRVLLQMVDSLLLHVEAAVLEKSYLEAFDILKACIRKMHLVIDRNDDYLDNIGEALKKIYQAFDQLLNAQIAPDLKKTIIAFIYSLSNRSAYRIIDLDHNIFNIGWKLVSKFNPENKLIEIAFDQVINQNKRSPDWIAAIWILIQKSGRVENMDRLNIPFDESDFVQGVNCLARQQKYSTLIWLNKHFSLVNFGSKSKIRWTESILKAATALSNQKIIVQTSIELMILTRQVHHFEKIPQTSNTSWSALERKAEKRIKSELVGNQKVHLLAHFYGITNRHDVLLEMLKKEKDIDLLIKFDRFLLPDLKRDIIALYIDIIEDYLTHYAGQANIQLIKKWKAHFESMGMYNSVDEVLNQLAEAHPERALIYKEVLKN